MTDITLRFPGAADATSGSTYKIERTLDNANWTVLAAAQAASAPYVSVEGALASSATYGATALTLAAGVGASFPDSGFGYLDSEALVGWTGKATDQLTGVTWLSGNGTYLSDSVLRVAHESFADSGVSITLGMVLYRITHINSAAVESAPAYVPYFAPPAPASSRHCVVLVRLATDLGVEARAAVEVTCSLISADQFIDATGQHLAQGLAASKTQTTNAFGLAFFQCYKNAGRVTKGGAAASGYTFTAAGLSATVSVIPDQDWVLLEDVVDA